MNLEVGVLALLITLIIAVISVSFGYGVLTNKVSSHTKSIEAIEAKYDIIDRKLDDLRLMVQEIKGKLENLIGK